MLIANEPHSSSKGILRGALTNGHECIFLIFYLDKDGIGGTYAKSPIIKIQVGDSYPYCVLSPVPDIVAGILAYWICVTLSFLSCALTKKCQMERSFVGLDDNDWFSSHKVGR